MEFKSDIHLVQTQKYPFHQKRNLANTLWLYANPGFDVFQNRQRISITFIIGMGIWYGEIRTHHTKSEKI